MGRPVTDKRERLIVAASAAFHEDGFADTTVARVARRAGIAPGAVFYYFKTKEELAAAVAARWCDLVAGYADELAADPDPWRRIERFVETAVLMRDMYAGPGCPLAGIVRDIRRELPALADDAERIYAVQFEWLRAQFILAGFEKADARRHATFLMATHHGAIHLAHAQADPTLLVAVAASLKDWLADLRRRFDRRR